MRLLICDDHESHITGGFIEYCIHNDIILMILPPHSSHYTQPLDLAIFSPLKTAMSVELSHIICTKSTMFRKLSSCLHILKHKKLLFLQQISIPVGQQ